MAKRKSGGDSDYLPDAEIETIIAEIINTVATPKSKLDRFGKKYPHFADKYPHLFKAACQPNFDQTQFEFFMTMWKGVQSQKVSQHDASVAVGQKLYQQYVEPLGFATTTATSDKKVSHDSKSPAEN